MFHIFTCILDKLLDFDNSKIPSTEQDGVFNVMSMEITGTFYQSELQKIDIKDDELWEIETILKIKGKGHNKQLYVKWLNWPHKFDSWVS